MCGFLITRVTHMTHLYLDISHNKTNFCDICHFSKQNKLPFQTKYELLQFDIFGPLPTQFVLGHNYFLTILDNHSRFTWIICLKSKFEVVNHVKTFITVIENQYNTTPMIVRTDNGPDFIIPQF